jgi:hypothetical protein
MKFYTISHEAAWVATGLLIPIFIIFIAFAAMFYLKLVSHKSEVKQLDVYPDIPLSKHASHSKIEILHLSFK